MKTKTKKQPKISPYAELTQKYASTYNQMQRAEDRCRVLGHEKETLQADVKKWERAYRDLKNTIGMYMAMMAGDYGIDKERARHLESEMFSEPGERNVPLYTFHGTNPFNK